MANVSKSAKLKALLDNCKDVPDKDVDNLYKKIIKPKKVKKVSTKKTISKVVDKDATADKVSKSDPKYKVLLKLLNKILKNLGKKSIKDITEFKNVDRLDIIKDENKKALTDMEGDILKVFNKAECGYYQRNYKNNYILSFIRKVCIVLGYECQYNVKEIHETIDGNTFRRTCYLYYIE